MALQSRPSRPARRPSLVSLLESLATPHRLDRYLELVDPMVTVRDLRAEVTAVRRGTGSVTLTLRPTRQWRGFEAGQFVQVGVVVDGVRHTRCYSPAGSQHDAGIELTVKEHAGGVVSGYLNREARVGLVVDLSPADGAFRLPDRRPGHVLLISGGSGITPVLAILRTLLAEGHAGPIAFLHYARTAGDVAYLPELTALADRHANLTLELVYTGDGGGGDLRGHFGPAHLDAVAPWADGAQTYLCGPAALMRSVRELYDGRGLADRLHSEEFTIAPAAADADATGELTFAASGVSAPNSGASLLEQAESAGLNPDFGCRMGICFTCTTVKTSGCTRNLRTGEIDADPDRPIQLCISAAVGDVSLDL
ncbi:ferredoxin reductase [Rhodococcus tukisamuensis]|uniref:Ferredoxin-NADP reductase n=1 Tax=Rhodococcus tukisamuensis TaxID=168276 RepID=A0A1G7A8H6_9NOCA|nr:ferredoxin reductase [Rhodococcus tukisamuensis]SDE11071.1 Ferredoxin-NADP reductase [Rhodococcus tukisamuensis]